MDPEKIGTIFVAGLLVIGVLSACNLGSTVADQGNPLYEATTVPDDAAASVPTVAPAKARPTLTPTKQTNTVKPTIGSTPVPKQPSAATNNKQPTPTVASAGQSTSKKQGDDLEQQLNQLLNNLNNTDTVNDAGQ